MSHILDAIRKAEQQRQEETVPSLEAMVHERRTSKGARRGKGWLIWVLLLIVVGASWYLNQDQVNRWGSQGIAVGKQWIDQGSAYTRSLVARLTGETGDAAGQGGGSAVGGQAAPDEPAPLTSAQRALLKQIRFNVISWSSDPDKRFAMVGNDTLREGDLLEGFPITGIRKDGVMVDVNGRAVLIRP